MEMKRESENLGRRKQGDMLVSDILKELFKYAGIDFDSVALIHWMVVKDDIIPQLIHNLGEIASFCGDGSYQIAIKNAVISGIEKETIEMPLINVEVSLRNDQWSELRIYTDIETCSPQSATPEALRTRLGKVRESIKEILHLVILIMKIAENLRDLSS